MKTRLLVPAAGMLVVVLVTACSSTVPEPPEPAGTRTPTVELSEETTAEAEPVEAEEPEMPPAPEPNERGNLVKRLGDTAGLTDETTGEWTLDFKVTEIVPNFQCTYEGAEPPVNGQYIALRFEVNTTAAWDSALMGDFSMNPYDFQVFDASNMRVNDPVGNAYVCLSEGERLPATMGPAQSANGTVVLDVPGGAGVVAYRPIYVQGGGWEWTYTG